MPTYSILVRGRVQGVFFRATAKKVADQSGVTGWIRNTEEGNVESMINGPNQATEKFIDWCRKGPGKAVVDDVVVTQVADQTFKEFIIKR